MHGRWGFERVKVARIVDGLQLGVMGNKWAGRCCNILQRVALGRNTFALGRNTLQRSAACADRQVAFRLSVAPWLGEGLGCKLSAYAFAFGAFGTRSAVARDIDSLLVANSDQACLAPCARRSQSHRPTGVCMCTVRA